MTRFPRCKRMIYMTLYSSFFLWKAQGERLELEPQWRGTSQASVKGRQEEGCKTKQMGCIHLDPALRRNMHLVSCSFIEQRGLYSSSSIDPSFHRNKKEGNQLPAFPACPLLMIQIVYQLLILIGYATYFINQAEEMLLNLSGKISLHCYLAFRQCGSSSSLLCNQTAQAKNIPVASEP